MATVPFAGGQLSMDDLTLPCAATDDAWAHTRAALDTHGIAVLQALLDETECASLRELYERPERFRSRVVMQRHSYGRGEYQYFSDPLPPVVQRLREEGYSRLVALANEWAHRLHGEHWFPPTHAEYRRLCHHHDQTRSTPLLLRYRAGDYNCLHQDLYGEQSFPLQMIVLLSQPGQDFGGGEIVLTEQRPRAQSRPWVVTLNQGDAAIIAVAQRPATGRRGDYRVVVRHGVSTIHWGERCALGVIFHDAR